MKLEDLKNCKIHKSKFVNDACEIEGINGSVARLVYFGRYDDSGFDDAQTALLAAARFRASEEMYRALDQMVFAITLLSDTTARKLEKHMEAARTALALADNTNETLSQ